ncbi:MAG: peptidase U32 family protein [Opitutales bacterium]
MNRTDRSPAPEILAPAGSYESLAAALNAGADAVFFGVGTLNMRARGAANFAEGDLGEIVKRCRDAGAKAYLTLNILVYDDELPLVERLCHLAEAAGVDAVIATDIATIQTARAAGLSVHLSTQANVSNLPAVRFFAQFADVVVLARELDLAKIRHIAEAVAREPILGPSGEPVHLEVFVHGALCVAISGQCGMSLATHNQSANRGACVQPCRRSYRVISEQTEAELVVDNKYVMSPRDLCTIGCLDRLLEAGASLLKIEGRGRAADYVAETVCCYREAVQAIRDGVYDAKRVAGWRERLRRVYNRDFWEGGYYLGEKTEVWSGAAGSQATTVKRQIGRVTNFFSQAGVAEICVTSGPLSVGDTVLFVGGTTGAHQEPARSLRIDENAIERVERAEGLTLPLTAKVRRGDKVFVVEPR